MGVCDSYVRLPLTKASDDLKNKIDLNFKDLKK
jgi:hypothetical protein